MRRCSNKNQCLRKKLSRRRQMVGQEVVLVVVLGVGEEEAVEQREKIDAKHR